MECNGEERSTKLIDQLWIILAQKTASLKFSPSETSDIPQAKH